MTKEDGIALLNSSTGITVVTKAWENINIGSEYFNPVKVHHLSGDVLAGRTPVASRSISRMQAKSWIVANGPTKPLARLAK